MKFQIIGNHVSPFTILQGVVKFAVMGFILAFFPSCSLSGDVEVKSIFQGIWAGSYTGEEDFGTWEMHVNETGEIIGTVYSDLLEQQYEIIGTIQNTGEVIVSSGTTTSGAVFTGYMIENQANGTWENALLAITGEWEGVRKVGLN